MRTIHKIILDPGETVVSLPKTAAPLATRCQRGNFYVWYIFEDKDRETMQMSFKIRVTGCPYDDEGWTYLGTNLTKDHSSVGHVFFKRLP